MIDSTSVLGYAKPMSVHADEEVSFHLSSSSLSVADIRIVRVRCGDPDENGPGLKLFHAPSSLDGEIVLKHQPIHIGSYGEVADNPLLRALTDFSVGCYIYPTITSGSRQVIVSRWNENTGTGWKLELDLDGKIAMTASIGGRLFTAISPQPVLKREWIFVAGSISLSREEIRVDGASLARDGGRDRRFCVTEKGPDHRGWPENTPLLFAAQFSGDEPPNKQTSQHFNGKIERPRLYGAAISGADMLSLVETLEPRTADPLLLGAWDFSRQIDTDNIVDISANNHHGIVYRLPMRAATGANWNGYSQSWKEAPQQYGAIHFHEDDLEDANWQPTTTITIPSNWTSGFYALQIRGGTAEKPVESYATFFVRPPRGTSRAEIAVIAPTATYLAYANNHARLDQSHFEVMADSLLIISQDDVYLNEHRELGHSTYDTHLDGSGVCYSTGARPILNTRPRANTFNYVNDTHLLDWLEEQGFAYDVITDEDMHREGAGVLKPYAVVLNMTHPEYYSKEMYDALEAYQNGGGRHMYLGGNGFYWRVAFHPTKKGILELRRGIAGTRSWEAEAGEGNLSFTGEPSGLWRSNGRAPQRICGVGFSAQVFDFSSAYRRMPGSFDPKAEFVFEGVGRGEPIGNFGLRMGGAAGLEIDRADETLGSPPDMLLLATADQTGVGGVPTPEELPAMYRGFTGEENAMVRADMVLFSTANGGAVFSTGSIAWCCALSHAGYDNNVSRITGNVLRRFLDPHPL
ncbi:N,N-dimethylformamidase beta subunit family domain-containing protein [Agrobacterium larrymoorei]|uniref:N,N-dimethylformamidase n=1 Tax=Agrobacterium larrymoorei TaxID=160699 RepID=A0AAF0KG16_9HYPH|nr:N,N-dimethylformamidase beta subunit family domain-containing protein [Agrobacterium larrymoorei]WHA43888.1 N,N-dimethylformamidase [Agrobacterium larrymoorei]